MKIHCHQCGASKIIKKESFSRSNQEVYCYCNPNVPTWMSYETKEQADRFFKKIVGKFGMIKI